MMEDAQEIRTYLEEHNPTAILWDDCDSALLGTARIKREDKWTTVAMYSYELLVQHFIEDFRASYKSKEEPITDNELEDMAIEYVDYNIYTAYIGPSTPMIIYT